MKNPIVFFSIIVLTFFYKVTSAQYFGLLQSNPKQYYATALSQPNDTNYRVLNFRHPAQAGTFRPAQILTFNQNLQLADSVNLLYGFNPSLYEPLKINNRFFWPGALYDTVNNNSSVQKPVIVELDTLYHFIKLHSLGAYETKVFFTSNLCFHNKHFYGGWSKDFNGPSIIYKLDSLLAYQNSASFSGWVQEIHAFNDDLLVKGVLLALPCSGGNDAVLIDTSLATLSCKNLQDFQVIKPCSKILKLSNKKYFIAGNTSVQYGFSSREAITNTVFDNTNQILQSHTFSYSPKNIVYVDFSNLAAFDGKRITTTAILDYNYSGLSEGHNSQIFVSNLDTLGNLLWKKLYGGDMFYRPNSIVFTKDGGCIIAGLRYDSTNATYAGIMESFLLKIDAGGNPVSVGILEHGTLRPAKASSYPNPSSGIIYFDFPFQENIELKIYDLTGNEIKSILPYRNLQEVNIENLPPAVYVYQLTSKKTKFTGKFVKTN
ncbi:hypothetical protein CNR22_00195 [Sphingobacteriaceae bacterium]|nr:hypothetical protein CNR22_00195 [Sphingobacteriaceae bacterium]